jgi:hypothetical protein
MSNKRKPPAASRIHTRTTEAPMLVSRPKDDISHDEIARLAYARFLARGSVHGFDGEDWFAAEAELRASR